MKSWGTWAHGTDQAAKDNLLIISHKRILSYLFEQAQSIIFEYHIQIRRVKYKEQVKSWEQWFTRI